MAACVRLGLWSDTFKYLLKFVFFNNVLDETSNDDANVYVCLLILLYPKVISQGEPQFNLG